jgi:NADP-dependent 3-hydroxy acid dehydrogenase YdfG
LKRFHFPMQISSYLKDLFGLQGKTAVVIGGTGELCGAMAVGLARAGAEVVLGGRIPEKAERRLAEIEADGGQGYFVPVDVTSRSTARASIPPRLSWKSPRKNTPGSWTPT